MSWSWHRKPRTTAERRENCGFETDFRNSEYQIKFRRRRAWKLLVDAWDDIMTHTDKSWKRHRKTQWKHKKEDSHDSHDVGQ